MLSELFHFAAVAVKEDWHLERLLLRIVIIYCLGVRGTVFSILASAFRFKHIFLEDLSFLTV